MKIILRICSLLLGLMMAAIAIVAIYVLITEFDNQSTTLIIKCVLLIASFSTSMFAYKLFRYAIKPNANNTALFANEASTSKTEFIQEISIEDAKSLAQAAVEIAADHENINLDFSPNSLVKVDEMLIKAHEANSFSKNEASMALALGCYVGEVMIRNLGGHWIDKEASHHSGEGLPLIELTESLVSNPIEKAYKALENGSEDSLHWFYQVAQKNMQPATE